MATKRHRMREENRDSLSLLCLFAAMRFAELPSDPEMTEHFPPTGNRSHQIRVHSRFTFFHHFNVCTSTEYTAGRSRTIAFHVLPLSAEQ